MSIVALLAAAGAASQETMRIVALIHQLQIDGQTKATEEQVAQLGLADGRRAEAEAGWKQLPSA